MKAKHVLFGFILVAAAATSALAIPTEITVYVKSKDAKFVGTSMGGAQIIIKDVRTGKVLAKGDTVGGTGSTARIMSTPLSRGVPLSDESTAKFTATIDIDRPTLIEVSAYGPSGIPKSANRVSATQWVVPGKHIIKGDAWLMELPGFVVEVKTPAAKTVLKGAPQSVTIHANIVMMCGCPITPNGMWDANTIEVAAQLSRDGKHVGVLPLRYAGSASQFSGTWNVREPGTYEATVYAYDAANGNTGVDSVTITVEP